jgi:hypothetical protein
MSSWHVWCPDRCDTREDSRAYEGDTPEEAAEAWAQRDDWNSAEYSIGSGRESPEVLVAPVDGSAEPVRCRVEGEAVPHYTARRLL